jgi:predicted RNA-binding protein with PUA-like domain
MSSAYLLKTEPSEYSFANLQRDKATVWDGVTNPAAVKNLGEMQPGAKLATGKPLAHPVSLAEIKANKLFAGSPLVRQGRLSVVPLTSEQYQALANS